MRKFVFVLALFLNHLIGFSQCNTAGTLAWEKRDGHCVVFFEEQPWTGCNGYGLGWTTPDSIKVSLSVFCCTKGDNTHYVFSLMSPEDTLRLTVNGKVIVSANTTHYSYLYPTPKTSPTNPIIVMDTIGEECFEEITVEDTIILDTVTVTPPPPNNNPPIENSVLVDSGKIYLSGTGIVNLIDWSTFAPVPPVYFENEQKIIDLNVLGGTQYRTIVNFTNPYEKIDLGVVQL